MKTHLCILFFAGVVGACFGAEQAGSKPVSVVLTNPKSGGPVPSDKPGGRQSGDIKMTFSDHHSKIVARNASSPRLSEKGDAGWIDAKEQLIIRTVDGKTRPWKTDPGDLLNAVIGGWDFADHGSALVVAWSAKPLLMNFFKYDFVSGNTMAGVVHAQEYDRLPAWAKPVVRREDFL